MYNAVLEPIYKEVIVEREGVFKTLILNIAEPIFAKVLRNECFVIGEFIDNNQTTYEEKVIEFDGLTDVQQISKRLSTIRMNYPHIMDAEDKAYREFQEHLPQILEIITDVVTNWIRILTNGKKYGII